MAATSGATRRDVVVADHAADFFQQVVFDRDVFGGAPTGHGDRENARDVHGDFEVERFENLAHLVFGDFTPQLAGEPVDRKLDRGRGFETAPCVSARPPTSRIPGDTSWSSSMARARPRTVLTGSCDFSNRMEASVRSLSWTDVLRTLAAWKFALSNTMRVVVASMAESMPPITPAIATGPLRVGDDQIGGFRSYVS